MSRSSERSLFFIRRQIRIARTVLLVGFLLVAARGAMLPYFRGRADAAGQHVASVQPATTEGLNSSTPNMDEPPVAAPAPEPDIELNDERPVAAPPAEAWPPTSGPRFAVEPVQPSSRRPRSGADPSTSAPAEPPQPRRATASPQRVVRRPAPLANGAATNVRRLPAVQLDEPPVVAPNPAAEDLIAIEVPAIHTPPAPGQAVAAELVIANPLESGGTVRFLLDGQTLALQPGEAHAQSAGRPPVILFHRGGDFGDAGYRLPAGRYLFQVTRQGWELFDERRDEPEASP